MSPRESQRCQLSIITWNNFSRSWYLNGNFIISYTVSSMAHCLTALPRTDLITFASYGTIGSPWHNFHLWLWQLLEVVSIFNCSIPVSYKPAYYCQLYKPICNDKTWVQTNKDLISWNCFFFAIEIFLTGAGDWRSWVRVCWPLPSLHETGAECKDKDKDKDTDMEFVKCLTQARISNFPILPEKRV